MQVTGAILIADGTLADQCVWRNVFGAVLSNMARDQ